MVKVAYLSLDCVQAAFWSWFECAELYANETLHSFIVHPLNLGLITLNDGLTPGVCFLRVFQV